MTNCSATPNNTLGIRPPLPIFVVWLLVYLPQATPYFCPESYIYSDGFSCRTSSSFDNVLRSYAVPSTSSRSLTWKCGNVFFIGLVTEGCLLCRPSLLTAHRALTFRPTTPHLCLFCSLSPPHAPLSIDMCTTCTTIEKSFSWRSIHTATGCTTSTRPWTFQAQHHST